MSDTSNTHSIEVLKERVDGLERFIDERDRRYEERFVAQDQKTTTALTASKEAIVKAENATEKRFDTVNEFRGTLSDQASRLLPRSEADARFQNYDEKFSNLSKEIQLLREFRSETGGASGRSKEDRSVIQWWIAFVVGVAGLVIGWVLKKP
jgi:hypothetical protein